MEYASYAAESDGHARVLLALHQELLAYGLDLEPAFAPSPSSFMQSAAGAFPPLRYVQCRGGGNGGGRVITIRALAMFDDLIVNGTAAPAEAVVAAGAGAPAEGVVQRRTTFDVSRWCDVLSSPGGDGEEHEEKEQGQVEQQQGRGQQVGRLSCS